MLMYSLVFEAYTASEAVVAERRRLYYNILQEQC